MPTTNKHEPLISLRGIGKGYLLGGQPLQILKDVCLDIFPGESCAIVGASGSGKSTLLNILGLLDRQILCALYPPGSSARGNGQSIFRAVERGRSP